MLHSHFGVRPLWAGGLAGGMWTHLQPFWQAFLGISWLLCGALLLCSVSYNPGDWGSHTFIIHWFYPSLMAVAVSSSWAEKCWHHGCFGDSSKSLQCALDVLDVPLNYCQVHRKFLGSHVSFQGLTCSCCQGMFSSNCAWNEITQLPFLSTDFPVHLHSTWNVLLAVCSPTGCGCVWLLSWQHCLKGPGSFIFLQCRAAVTLLGQNRDGFRLKTGDQWSQLLSDFPWGAAQLSCRNLRGQMWMF